jgi:two-component system, LuxR family, sensor kinase FixL
MEMRNFPAAVQRGERIPAREFIAGQIFAALNAQLAVIGTSLDGKIISWNRGAQKIFHHTEKSMGGKNLAVLLAPERRDDLHGILEGIRSGSGEMESIWRRRRGGNVDVAITFSAIKNAAGKVIGAALLARDITDRKRLEKEILEISDKEKQRIGQDLHDDLCQYLVGISLLSNVLYENLMRQSLHKEAADAKQITDLVKPAVSQARSMAKGLSPLDLAGSGFISALEDLALNAERRYRISCKFISDDQVIIEDGAVAMHLYRIAQEALNNAIKHSQGDQMKILLNSDGEVVTIAVKDNGVGIPKNQPRTGLGMQFMHYRARMIGASLKIRKPVAGGTALICSVRIRK